MLVYCEEPHCFIADFYRAERFLIIELDGEFHNIWRLTGHDKNIRQPFSVDVVNGEGGPKGGVRWGKTSALFLNTGIGFGTV